jgi:5-methylcytosine-specific restriction endonuclease McrA
MATQALHPCNTPGCRALVRGQARCPAHTRATARNSKALGYDKAWRTLRDLFIHAHPQCSMPGCTKQAEIVHHVIPTSEAMHLRLDERNLRSLCRACHGREHGDMGTWQA